MVTVADAGLKDMRLCVRDSTGDIPCEVSWYILLIATLFLRICDCRTNFEGGSSSFLYKLRGFAEKVVSNLIRYVIFLGMVYF